MLYSPTEHHLIEDAQPVKIPIVEGTGKLDMPLKSGLPIPRPTVLRISRYLHALQDLMEEGIWVIASHEMARRCGVLPTQLRKDLSLFGDFGVRGLGYSVSPLYTALRRALGVDREWRVALVGMDDMGKALICHEEFQRRGFAIAALFDTNPHNVGLRHKNMCIYGLDSLREVVQAQQIELGVIVTPPEHAKNAADALIVAGVKGIMNFSPRHISVPPSVPVEQMKLVHYALALSLHLSRAELTWQRSVTSPRTSPRLGM